jgi:hypothetical protein
MARLGDPLRDCIAKFDGRWRTGSGQFDATAVHAEAGGPAQPGITPPGSGRAFLHGSIFRLTR